MGFPWGMLMAKATAMTCMEIRKRLISLASGWPRCATGLTKSPGAWRSVGFRQLDSWVSIRPCLSMPQSVTSWLQAYERGLRPRRRLLPVADLSFLNYTFNFTHAGKFRKRTDRAVFGWASKIQAVLWLSAWKRISGRLKTWKGGNAWKCCKISTSCTNSSYVIRHCWNLRCSLKDCVAFAGGCIIGLCIFRRSCTSPHLAGPCFGSMSRERSHFLNGWEACAKWVTRDLTPVMKEFCMTICQLCWHWLQLDSFGIIVPKSLFRNPLGKFPNPMKMDAEWATVKFLKCHFSNPTK